MIAFVRGEVAEVTLTGAVLAVGGVGLEVQCTPGTLATLRVGQRATLPTSMVVREDSLTLFGFLDDDEKTVFELVQTASGVGPKLAQAMLAVLPPDALRTAVAQEDVKTLTRVPGIGQKGAQRIILELKDRLGGPVGGGAGRGVPAAAAAGSWRTQVHQGLVGLGWPAKDAERAVESVAADMVSTGSAGDPPDVAALLRAALRMLSKA
jgi:holliday junction DNA helicase RuvA